MTTMTDRDAADDTHSPAVRAVENELARLVHQVRQTLLEIARAIEPTLQPATYRIFATVVRDPQTTSSALAERLQMDKGQVSRALRDLEELRLVQRSPDPTDGRSTLLSPTAEGTARFERAHAPRRGLLAEVFESWDLDDITAFTNLLRRFLDDAEAARPGRP